MTTKQRIATSVRISDQSLVERADILRGNVLIARGKSITQTALFEAGLRALLEQHDAPQRLIDAEEARRSTSHRSRRSTSV